MFIGTLNDEGETPKQVKYFELLPPEVEKVATATVDAAYKIHKAFGPGLSNRFTSSVSFTNYAKETCCSEQIDLPIHYDGIVIDSGLRPDLLIADVLIVEVKAVEQMNPVYQAQLLTYLKFMKKRLGLLLNFNVPVISKGSARIIL